MIPGEAGCMLADLVNRQTVTIGAPASDTVILLPRTAFWSLNVSSTSWIEERKKSTVRPLKNRIVCLFSTFCVDRFVFVEVFFRNDGFHFSRVLVFLRRVLVFFSLNFVIWVAVWFDSVIFWSFDSQVLVAPFYNIEMHHILTMIQQEWLWVKNCYWVIQRVIHIECCFWLMWVWRQVLRCFLLIIWTISRYFSYCCGFDPLPNLLFILQFHVSNTRSTSKRSPFVFPPMPPKKEARCNKCKKRFPTQGRVNRHLRNKKKCDPRSKHLPKVRQQQKKSERNKRYYAKKKLRRQRDILRAKYGDRVDSLFPQLHDSSFSRSSLLQNL